MATDGDFPCALTLRFPFPDARLSTIALKAIRVDKELSPLVHRELSTVAPDDKTSTEESVLQVEYKAATNRMLRVAVNSFMDSLSLVLEVMEEMDVDVLEPPSAS
ncbi:CTAG/Pcc1 family [Rhypophila decipiens]